MSETGDKDLSRIDLAVDGVMKRYQENVSGEAVVFRVLTPRRTGPLISKAAKENGFTVDLVFDLFDTDFVLLTLHGPATAAKNIRLRLRKAKFTEIPAATIQSVSASASVA